MLLSMKRAAKFAGWHVKETSAYEGKAEVLVLYGVGSPLCNKARWHHVKSGRRAVLWDLGYFGRKKQGGFYRVSIDTDHPQAWIDGTPNDGSRLAVHDVHLREDGNPEGHIVIVGLGRKSRRYLKTPEWESETLRALQIRFPDRQIVYRPKPGQPSIAIGCQKDERPIEQVLKGAALVVCRHSNVAVDAIVAGVPFEAEDGAAVALQSFTPEARQEFLNQLAWWQWKESEAAQAWRFLSERV